MQDSRAMEPLNPSLSSTHLRMLSPLVQRLPAPSKIYSWIAVSQSRPKSLRRYLRGGFSYSAAGDTGKRARNTDGFDIASVELGHLESTCRSKVIALSSQCS